MPPFLPRKRSSPSASTRPTPTKRARLADALDADATNSISLFKKTKTFSVSSDGSSSDSELSDLDSDEFEDIAIQGEKSFAYDQADEEEDEDDVVWEDAAVGTSANMMPAHIPMANGPIQITLRKDDENIIDYGTAAKAGSGKKGPSKREKYVRIVTHKLHVQFLLWHNAVRNSWIGDKRLQDILIQQLPSQILKEVEKWKKASGLFTASSAENIAVKKGKKQRQTKREIKRNQRDWGEPSQRLEAGKADMSHGDPLIHLMKVLAAYWKKKFAITAPGLRKRGYGTRHGLKQDISSLRHDEHDPEKHGEKISNIAEFRKVAQKSEGSRDVGAQLFTALLRSLGIDARLVASLQPSGYGWTKVEQMIPRKPTKVVIDDGASDEDFAPDEDTVSHPRKKDAKTKLSNDDNNDETETKDDDSVVDVTPSMPKQRKPKYDRDLVFPIYWTEVVSPVTNKILPVSPLVLETSVASTPETLSFFEPRGAKAEKGRQVMAYVVAYSPDGSAKDVTVRYLRKHIWPGKTKGFRVQIEKVPIYDTKGKIKCYEDYDWFKSILSPYIRSYTKRTMVDDIEDTTDLMPQEPEKKDDEGTDTLQSLKASADYVLERFLRREEALKPNATPVRAFISGKGDKYKEEPVYRRADVERCLTAESWHKEGRRPKLGETPMKMVPVRAVTLTRKREAEEHERLYGEKQMQGLYSWDQCEWIIPLPIEDGVIPKNAYGNMDCFVPSMVPKGAVHLPLKGTVRICKKLDIDFAEAVTGFEFGNKRAVPICTGVVVASENEQLVKDAWIEWNNQQRQKEETKMEKLVLDLWRKFVLGLRIRERVQDMYGEDLDIVENVATGLTQKDAIAVDEDEEERGGGFASEQQDEDIGGGFLLPHDEEATPMEELVMDREEEQLPVLQKSNFASSSISAEGQKQPQSRNQTKLDQELDISDVDSVSDRKDMNGGDVQQADEDTSYFKHPGNSNRYAPHKIESTDDPDTHKSDAESQISAIDEHNNGITENIEEGEDDDNDAMNNIDEDEESEDIYKPRSTRIRSTKFTSPGLRIMNAEKLIENQEIAKKGRGRPKGSTTKKASTNVAKTRKSKVMVDDDESDIQSELTSSARRRSRGKPRGSGSQPKPTNTSKRSTRLLRKESTLVTSPYFEH